MNQAATVWLVGMMGAGKSSVGRVLAARLQVPFVDADEEIERAADATVAEIFEREGEAGFRARERDTIGKLAGLPAVVALGGGAMAQPGVPEVLARTGTVIYLRARPETLAERVGEGRARPLLAGLDPEARLARLRELLAEREPHYGRAGIVVDTDGREIGSLAAELAERLGELEP